MPAESAFSLDGLTPKRVYDWGKELSSRASQFGEIQATLIVNCEEGRRLHKLGVRYDKHLSVLHNLVGILDKLAGLADAAEQSEPE